MRLRHPGSVRAVLAGSAAIAAFATSGPAFAQAGHSLALSGPATATVGSPSTLQATGTVPEDVFFNRYLNVYAIPTSVVGACPATFQNAIQLSYSSSAQGGETVANTVPAEGNFTIPVAYTPRVAGRFHLCGYLHEGVETMAAGSMSIDVQAAGGPGGGTPGAGKPGVVKRPKVTRSKGKLVCQKGKWSGRPTKFSYSWKADGRRKPGATKRTLAVTRKLRGHKVACVVKAKNAAGTKKATSPAVTVR